MPQPYCKAEEAADQRCMHSAVSPRVGLGGGAVNGRGIAVTTAAQQNGTLAIGKPYQCTTWGFGRENKVDVSNRQRHRRAYFFFKGPGQRNHPVVGRVVPSQEQLRQ